MQLKVFTPLQNSPMTAEQIADEIGVVPTRLPLLLYALVAAGLLTEQDGQFANTPEAQHFLVKGKPSYMSNALRQMEDKLIWARGYAVSTIGFELEQIRSYIRDQDAADDQGRFGHQGKVIVIRRL